MATLSDLPAHLHEHARAMPKGLLVGLHTGEAVHRLQAVHEMAESANRISNPAVHRHVKAHSRRLLSAMPYLEYTAEHKKLSDLKNKAIQGQGVKSDVAKAYHDALKKLEYDHEQVSGVGEAMLRWDREHPKEVSKAAQAAAVKKIVDRELSAALADFKRKSDQLRKEIRQLQEEATRGRR